MMGMVETSHPSDKGVGCGRANHPIPRALLPSVLSARDTVAGTHPGISWGPSLSWKEHHGLEQQGDGAPQTYRQPPLSHLCHHSQSCRASGTASLTPRALGSRFGGRFGSHTKPGALAPPSPVLPNPQPAAPSSLHSSCRLSGAAQGSQLTPFSHSALLQLLVGDGLCELSSGKPLFIL